MESREDVVRRPLHVDPVEKITARKKLLFFGILCVGFVLLFEGGARAVYFLKEGFNPFYITYGFVPNIGRHSDERDGYAKFQPNAIKHERHRDGTITMRINGDGFRGLYDFTRPKPADVFRGAGR